MYRQSQKFSYIDGLYCDTNSGTVEKQQSSANKIQGKFYVCYTLPSL